MLAYVFPGQGVQKKGMGADLFPNFPDLCRQARDVLGYSVVELCLEDPGRRLSRTEYSQPAVFVVNALHYLAARRRGSRAAQYLAGHSLGEYNALFAAGAFDFQDGLALVQHRAELTGKAQDGGMAAVIGLTSDRLQEALEANRVTNVVLANYNAPEEVVLSGQKDELARTCSIIEKIVGVRAVVPLRVGGAFHSPLMKLAAESFRGYLEKAHIHALTTPVVSSATGKPLAPSAEAIREELAEQITRPVRWIECVEYMRSVGVSDFVELGDSNVLTSLIEKITAAENAGSGAWRDYRDERVLSMLVACANGTLTPDEVIRRLRVGVTRSVRNPTCTGHSPSSGRAAAAAARMPT